MDQKIKIKNEIIRRKKPKKVKKPKIVKQKKEEEEFVMTLADFIIEDDPKKQ